MNKLILYIILLYIFFSCQSQYEKTKQGQLQFVKSHLKYGTEKSLIASEKAVKELVKKVKRGGKSPEGRERVKRAKESIKDLKIILLYIQNLKTQLKKEAKTSQKLDRQIVKDFMLGKVQNGKKLRLKLEKYVEMLYKKYGDLGFSKEYGDFPMFVLRKTAKTNQFYEEYEFSYCTVLECQNILSHVKQELIRYNHMVLKKLGADDLARGTWWFRIVAFVNSEEEVIKLGQTYKANMRLTANTYRMKVKGFLNGQTVKVYGGFPNLYYFQVNLPTNEVGNFDYKAQIKLSYSDRIEYEYKDTTILITEKYKVIP